MEFNRRALIDHYFRGCSRLTWLIKGEDSELGRWVACFIAAATARRGVEFRTLRQAVDTVPRKMIDRSDKFTNLCNAVVSGNREIKLRAYEPDILGETYFLMFLKNCPDFEDELPTLIAAEGNDMTDKNVREFVAFITRLARNLSNDDQEDNDTQTYWGLLRQFLAPDKFEPGSPLKWAASMACFEIYLILKGKEQTQGAELFLNRVEVEVLYHPPREKISARHIWIAIQFFGLSEKEGESIPSSLIESLRLWDDDQNRGYTALMLSLWAENSTIANYLIDQGADIKAVGINSGWTALMIACRHGQEAVALKLVDKNANLEAQDSDNVTALMIACRYGQEAVALKLVEKNANLEAQNSEKLTALMIACGHNQEVVALKLVDKNANLEAQDREKWTAIMIACRYDQEAVALKLIDKNVEINLKNEEGQTILMFAVFSNQKNIVRVLLNKDVDTNEIWKADKISYTALGLARAEGHREIIKMLEEKGALETPPYEPAPSIINR